MLAVVPLAVAAQLKLPDIPLASRDPAIQASESSKQYRACVIAKATALARTKETPGDVVLAASGACASYRSNIIFAYLRLAATKEDPMGVATRVMNDLDADVRPEAFEAVFRARYPEVRW